MLSTRDETEARFESWADMGIALYAVYESDPGTTLLFTFDRAGTIILLEPDGLISYVAFGCAARTPEWLVEGVTDFILAPPAED